MDAVVQQLFTLATNSLGQAAGTVSNDTASAAGNATNPSNGAPTPGMPINLGSIISLLFSFTALRDWLKLIIIGSVIETFRRFFFSTWQSVIESFWITAQFKQDDSSFDWIMVWLSKQKSWQKARSVEISTSNFGLNDAAIVVPGEDIHDSNSRKLAYIPSISASYSLWYKGHYMQIYRTQGQTGYYGRAEDMLHISILARNHKILNELLLEAKKNYLAAEEHNISIYISDSSNNWRHVASRPKRPLKSIVLEPGIKDLLVEDAMDFLDSKQWYADRGIPFRRGYLLYGAPGSGKTSMIHSMAGELGLDVYVISLSRAGLDDTALQELISELPEKCIALMEDIDAAFHRGLENRDLSENEDRIPGAPGAPGSVPGTNDPSAPPPPPNAPAAPLPVSRITLSGLLNALDGVGAQEGRILYATTNKYSALDPALCRPGRMDLHVEFKLASHYQAKELFRCFYLPAGADESGSATRDNAKLEVVDEKEKIPSDSGYSSPIPPTTPRADLINLAPLEEKPDSELLTPVPIVPLTPSSPEPISTGLTLPPSPYFGTSHKTRAPNLSRATVDALADQFSACIPQREFSMASLQGYLMAYKTRPYEAVAEAKEWIEKERREKAAKSSRRTAIANPAPAIASVAEDIKAEPVAAAAVEA